MATVRMIGGREVTILGDSDGIVTHLLVLLIVSLG